MEHRDFMEVLYPSKVNRTSKNEDLYRVKQSLKNKKLISLDYIGVSYPDPFYEIRTLNSTSFSIEYVISGKGYIVHDKTLMCAEAGDTFVLHTGRKRHYYSDTEDSWNKIFITFSGKMAHSLAKMYSLEDICLIKGFDTHDELNEIVNLAKYAGENGIDNTSEILTKLHGLAHKIYCHIHTDDSIGIAEIIKESLDSYINRDFNMDALAKSMYKSKSQITRLFKSTYGETPYKYLLKKRMDFAKNLLVSTKEPLKNIATDLCFYDEYYFSSYFKTITGYSPSEYRKMFSLK